MRVISLLTALAAHWQAARARRVTTRELATMSGCELSDMGITRLDVSRLFEPRPMSEFQGSDFQGPEFRSHRGAGRVATAATFKALPQRSADMTIMESSV
jgi:uncharacterized protein YjiS (DUF1127 family)